MAKKKKGKDPAFLMYSGDFLAGTYTMNYEQKGKYITLMCIHHQKGFLTEIDLQSVLSDTDIVVASKFFKDTDGNYYNQKMQDVILERKTYTEERLSHFNKDKGSHKSNHKSSHMELHTGDEDEDVNKDRLKTVYSAPDVPEIKNTIIEEVEYTEAVISKAMINTIIDKFVYKINSRFKFQSVMSEIDEDYGGFDNLIELAFPNDTSAQNNFKKQLQQYKNGIFSN
jgi:hypothetical protein